MEQVQVSIDVALPPDALAMEQLRYENHMYRVRAGELKLSSQKIEEMKVTEESVRALRDGLAKSDDDDYYLIARNQGQVVGFCQMTWRSESRQYQLGQFYARPEFIGTGIGSKLFAEAKARAQRSPHSPRGIFGLTRSFNVKMRARNEHWGFRYARPDECDFEQNAAGTIVKMILDFESDLIDLGS